MKALKQILTILLLSLVLIPFAHGGDGDSGGGSKSLTSNEGVRIKSAKLLAVQKGQVVAFGLRIPDGIEDIRALNGMIGVSRDGERLLILMDIEHVRDTARKVVEKEIHITNSDLAGVLFQEVFDLKIEDETITIDLK